MRPWRSRSSRTGQTTSRTGRRSAEYAERSSNQTSDRERGAHRSAHAGNACQKACAPGKSTEAPYARHAAGSSGRARHPTRSARKGADTRTVGIPGGADHDRIGGPARGVTSGRRQPDGKGLLRGVREDGRMWKWNCCTPPDVIGEPSIWR